MLWQIPMLVHTMFIYGCYLNTVLKTGFICFLEMKTVQIARPSIGLRTYDPQRLKDILLLII